MQGVRPSAIRDLLAFGADPDLISFGGGYPDPALFPVDGLREAYAAAFDAAAGSLQYTVTDGLPRLREQIAARLRLDGAATRADEVLVLQGAQQGLDLVAKLLLDPGDVVITEDPTFLGGLIAFAPYEPRVVAVPLDDDGMDVAALEAALVANPGAKLIYTMPDFHNPTGVTLSLERRTRLIDLANRFGVTVLEDTPYRELRYSGEQLPTLRSLDTEGRVIHLGSFSKVLAPGMRLGWAAAPAPVIDALSLLKLAADTQTSTLNMAAAVHYLDHNDLDRHISGLRSGYRRKRDLMLAAIATAFPSEVTATAPDGGLFTWLTFAADFDSAAFLADSAVPLAKVAYVPGATFFPTHPRRNHARVNFSGVTDDAIIAGVTRLGALLSAVPAR